jgi:dihydrodipicolinate synthase/N-acetylneuraminate lyase
MPVPFNGLGVALITLFDPGGEVDVEATSQHAPRLVELGVRLVLVAGGTGEAATLTSDERVRLIRSVRAILPMSVPVLAGTGANSAAAAAQLTAAARNACADGIVALSPPGATALVRYYTAVAEAAASLPVLAYHFPDVSPPGIPVEVLLQLPVAGLKDSSRDADRLISELTTWAGSVFVGSTSMLQVARSYGAAGAILGIANAEPKMSAAALAGDRDAEQAVVAANRVAGRAFPQGIKELTAARFGTSPATRRPY